MQSEVAFHPYPDKFFLPKSNKLNLLQQQYIISEYSYGLQREFGSEDIMAVMGDVADYTLLAFLHLAVTQRKEQLFGARYGFSYARTKTHTNPSHAAVVGNFSAWGLCVNAWQAGRSFDHAYAVPLIVPV